MVSMLLLLLFNRVSFNRIPFDSFRFDFTCKIHHTHLFILFMLSISDTHKEKIRIEAICSVTSSRHPIIHYQLNNNLKILKLIPSSPVFYPKLMFSPICPIHSPYLSIRFSNFEPSVPTWPVTPLGPVSFTWSLQAYSNSLL